MRGETLLWGAALAAIAISGPASAQEILTGMDIRLGVEASKNPYLEQGDTEVTGAVLAEFRPWLRQQSGRTTLDIEGSVQARQYSSRYGFEDNYRASARISHRASERLSLTAGTSISSSVARLDGLDRLGSSPPVGPSLPVNPVSPILPDDYTVFGFRGRTTVADIVLGAQYALDARRSIGLDLDFQDLSYERANTSDFRTYGAQGRFSQVVNETTSIGVIAGYRKTDYRRQLSGDATTLTAMGNVNHRLDTRWTLDASLGASRTKVDATPLAPSGSWTSLSAQASLCRRDDRGNFCVDYRRSPQPSGLGSVRNTDLAGATYYRRLSERDRLSLGGSYSRSSGTTGLSVVEPTVEYLSANASFERDFHQRLTGFVSASASKVWHEGISVEPSINVGAGIVLRLGQRR